VKNRPSPLLARSGWFSFRNFRMPGIIGWVTIRDSKYTSLLQLDHLSLTVKCSALKLSKRTILTGLGSFLPRFFHSFSVMVKKHTGSGGGLFTRRVSEADPLFAERLSAIANHKNLRRNSPAGYQTLSIQNAVLKREEGIGRPRNLSLVS